MELPAGLGGLQLAQGSAAHAAAFYELQRAIVCEGGFLITEVDEYRMTPARMRRFVRDLVQADNAFMLVLTKNERLLGAVIVQGGGLRRMRHVGRLEIYLYRDWRGKGLGKAMLRAAIRQARDNPVLTKLSLAVYAHNERARRLYQEHGFVEEGYRRWEYRLADGTPLDDVLMALHL